MQRSDVHTVDSKLSDGSSATGKPPVATLHREHVHRLDDVKELEALHDSAITAEDIEFLEAFQADGRAKKLMRKVDVRVLPILIFLYLIAFVDRANIGNAKIEGIMEDLNLSGAQYNWALTVFFFAYGPAEVPANIFMKILRPSLWIPSIMFVWGVILTLQGIVTNYGGLVACRFFMGVAEAGFFPAAIFTLSCWYLRGELGRRVAYLYGSASLAGAFSGILAFGIAKMDGIAGLGGWRWLFIIEGIFTCVVACFVPFLLPDSIERVKWLSDDERRYLARRIHHDRQGRDKGPFKWRYVKQVMKDPRIWLMSGVFFATGTATYGLSFTYPSIIRELGYTSAQAQLLTIPPYACACLMTFLMAHWQDHWGHRYRFVVGPVLLAVAGFIIVIATPKPGYPGLVLWGSFFIASGLYSCVPAIISWMNNNVAGEWKRGLAGGLQIGIASSGGLIGSNIYLVNQAPQYPVGYGVSVALLGTAVILSTVNLVICKRLNAQREAMSEADVRAKYTQDELDDMADASPLFRYEH